ncbi:bestrophin family ion channel [Dyella silvatica]|uniref:bestrophin family ion channel n=1 Tax=Dyella silvatica TaxID=2992128 RepID=UPI00224E4F2A|nr:bestrophin family ion channel [Dyella silvatica]
MERIKNTPLPQQYATYPTLFTHAFCILLPLGMVESLQLYTPLGSTAVGFLFLALLQIGNDMQNPFENTENDVPLTTITRNIEIDLRDGLGEAHGLKPAPVEDGVLW